MHLELVGKLAKLTPNAPIIEKHKSETKGYGYHEHRVEWFLWCQWNYEDYALIFLPIKPEWDGSEWSYCLQEIGAGYKNDGDWLWFSLSQLIICKQ